MRASDPAADEPEGDEATITYWCLRIAEHCLHGVDVKPMAPELEVSPGGLRR